MVLPWASILDGAPAPGRWTFGDPTLWRVRPAQVLSSSNDVHLVAMDADTGHAMYQKVTGTGSGFNLEMSSTGTGSGLLDLSREADDTSLGSELLDEIYSADQESGASASASPSASGIGEGTRAGLGGSGSGTAAAEQSADLTVSEELASPAPQRVVPVVLEESEGGPIEAGLTGAVLGAILVLGIAGVAVSDTVIEQLAAAEAVLTPDEKELGVALVDIGGGNADLAIFERGSLWHTGVVAIGGDHFTNDIAVGLRTPIPDAEKVKRKNGCALSSMVDEDETIDVASVGGRKPRVMARRILSEILQPRAEETFHLVWDEIRRAGYEKSLNSGIVLTGGGSILEGMPEIAEQIFDLPIRRGSPVGVGGLADHVNSPVFATAVGVVLYAHRNRVPEPSRGGAGAFSRVAGRLRGIFKEFF